MVLVSEHESTGLLPRGTRLGAYEIVRPIGHGGMGMLYLARHVDLNRDAAIKTIHPAKVDNKSIAPRLLHEGRVAARVRHPNVVDVYDTGTFGDLVYLVMEYLEGRSLDDHLEAQGRLSPADTAAVLLPVAAALDFAHQRGVVHRDIKPSNIFLSRGPREETIPKVLDFGISKMADASAAPNTITEPGVILGSLPYLSPEQASNRSQIDARADQYSLAVIAYRCLTGTIPFKPAGYYQMIWQIVVGEYAPIAAVAPELPRSIGPAIETAMARTPDGRFASIASFAQHLLDVADGPTVARWQAVFDGARPTATPSATGLTSMVGSLRRRQPQVILRPLRTTEHDLRGGGRSQCCWFSRRASSPEWPSFERPRARPSFRGPRTLRRSASWNPHEAVAFPSRRPTNASPPRKPPGPVLGPRPCRRT